MAGMGGAAGQGDARPMGGRRNRNCWSSRPGRSAAGRAGRAVTVPAQRRGQAGPASQRAGWPGPPRGAARTGLTGQAIRTRGERPVPAPGRRAGRGVRRDLCADPDASADRLPEPRFHRVGLHGALRLEIQSLWLAALALAILFSIIPFRHCSGSGRCWWKAAPTPAPRHSSYCYGFPGPWRATDSLEVRAVSPPRECARDISNCAAAGQRFISCFPHGRDLYVG